MDYSRSNLIQCTRYIAVVLAIVTALFVCQYLIRGCNSNYSYQLGKGYLKIALCEKRFDNNQAWLIESSLIKALKTDPKNRYAMNFLAWILATCPEGKYRDGERTMALAKSAVKIEADPINLDTLAAAWAETGRFEEAVTTQKKAVALAKEADYGKELMGQYMERLNSYRYHMPWRDE